MEERGTLVLTWGNSPVSPELLTWLVTIAHPKHRKRAMRPKFVLT
jgi:hypothetical protein